jgi:hypothetical protein
MDPQSEWITLRHVHAFLKLRNLKATASMLEQEARLKFDYPHVRALLSRGRWRSADEYVSSFLGGAGASAPALFVARFERFVRALRRGDRAWALRYFHRSLEPVLANNPREAKLRADCLRALRSSPASLRRDHPDDAQNRERCVTFFTALILYSTAELYRSNKAFVHDRFMRYKFNTSGILGIRRHARPRRRRSSD